jgi:hypothetical protein
MKARVNLTTTKGEDDVFSMNLASQEIPASTVGESLPQPHEFFALLAYQGSSAHKPKFT